MKSETIFRAYIKARDRMEQHVSQRRMGLWNVNYQADINAEGYRKASRQAERFENAIFARLSNQ
jgi:hypothetical protein